MGSNPLIKFAVTQAQIHIHTSYQAFRFAMREIASTGSDYFLIERRRNRPSRLIIKRIPGESVVSVFRTMNRDGISYITCRFEGKEMAHAPTHHRWLVAYDHLLRKHVKPTYVGKNRASVNVGCIWWKKQRSDAFRPVRASVSVCIQCVVPRKSADQRLTAGKMPRNAAFWDNAG